MLALGPPSQIVGGLYVALPVVVVYLVWYFWRQPWKRE